MKTIAKMFVIYGVLVLLVVEVFNFIVKSSLFFLSLLVGFAGLLEGPLGSAAAIPQTILRLIVYFVIPLVIIIAAFALMKAVGVAAPAAAGAAGGVTGFASKTGSLAGKLGMSGVRGAGVKKGALRSGVRALGSLSGSDLRNAGLASNIVGAKGMGKNLFRAGAAKDGFDAVRGTKAGQNKGKVSKAGAEGIELDKDGKPIKDSKLDKDGKPIKDSKEAADKDQTKKADIKDGNKIGGLAGTAAAAGVGAGVVGDKGSEASELTKEEERTENERVAEGVREKNNLDKTAAGEKVPGSAERDRDLSLNRTNTEIKNATLNGSSTALEPSSRTNSVDKNVDIGTNKDGIPVDAGVADASARKTNDALKGIVEAAPGQPVSEDGAEKAQVRSTLVARNEDGQAVSTFADDEIRRSGETLASATAMHGTVVPRGVTDSGDLSAENIEAQTAVPYDEYMSGSTDAAREASAGDLDPEEITNRFRGQSGGGSVAPMDREPEMVPVQGAAQPGHFSDGVPLPQEPVDESRMVSDPMVQTSQGVAEQVVRHEHHHFADSASGLLGAGSMGMMDRGDALAALMGGALGGLMGSGGGGGAAPSQPDVNISQDTMRALDQAVSSRAPRDRSVAKGAFMDEVGRAAPDAAPEVISEMENRFEEAIAAAERRAMEEAEERERNRSTSDTVNRGKRRRR